MPTGLHMAPDYNPLRREFGINSISIQCIPHRSTLSTRIIQFLDFLACSLKGFCVVGPHCMAKTSAACHATKGS